MLASSQCKNGRLLLRESSTKASFLPAFKLAKARKPFSEGEFLKDHMIETAGKFEKIRLSQRTVTRRVELTDIETNADHQDLLYHSCVRWLSLGKGLQKVWELNDEISAYLELNKSFSAETYIFQCGREEAEENASPFVRKGQEGHLYHLPPSTPQVPFPLLPSTGGR
ncbi:hypothetical protein FQN60_007150 [Etheostoma spectabile]|uniref:Uncharacterized protein n=1 Tax=Etheostoma spectabile TaxID=54343 RepID=A0A5J5CF98_9PERO|nr:hypothetical protein FQN60_007150 [Etheostoma spectabile]